MKQWKEKAKSLKQNIDVIAIIMKKPETPILTKILAAITIGYALSPIDLIPDFIPILGYVDDLILLPLLLFLTIHMIPKDLFEQTKQEIAMQEHETLAKKWRYAIPILFLYTLLLCWILKWLLL